MGPGMTKSSTKPRTKSVLLVGHCNTDSATLRRAILKADASAEVIRITSQQQLLEQLARGIDLVLVNRLLSRSYDSDEGVDLIATLASDWPRVRFMMISNYDETQAAAQQVGGVRGFGKRDTSSPEVIQLLTNALNGR